MKKKNLAGERFGKLIAISSADDQISKSGRHRTRWLCLCDCGNKCAVLTDNLVSGRTKSCGCVSKDRLRAMTKTHGETNTHLYGIWSAIKTRCYNPNSEHYDSYGGRGIAMCDEWRNSYEAFRDWSNSHGYRQGLSIDRCNNDGNYEPGNCRWVDRVVQANNRRSNRILTIGNESHNVTEWAKIIGMNPKTLFTRLYTGKDIENILSK